MKELDMKKMILSGASILALSLAGPALAQATPTTSTVTQTGDGNRATVIQSTNSNSSTINQNGNTNTATVS
jgi:hypothetical protein